MIISSIFSTFDPATPLFLHSNWFSIIIWLLIIPLSFNVRHNRTSVLLNQILIYLINEFIPLLNNNNYLLSLSLSLFLFLIINNVPSLIPYIFSAPTHLPYSLSLALSIWAGLLIYSLYHNLHNLLTHLIPQGTPIVLNPFIVLVETTSNLIRPITLAIRLSANIIAGHLLISLLMSASLSGPLWLNFLLITPQTILTILELAVAFIQAYVFSVLITLYNAEHTS